MTDKKTEALKLALDAICGSGDFLFNWHDCEPNNEREIQRYQATIADNEKAFKAIREALADHTEQHLEMIEKRAYSWKYDAYFNPDTNEWEERTCVDTGCEYCKNRPERPLDDDAAHWDMLDKNHRKVIK